MKIGVIGTINKDFILPFRHSPIESFGGILYDISVLSVLLNEEDEIIPVSYLGHDVYDALISWCNRRPNVSSNGLVSIDERNHNVIIEYHTLEDRTEKSLFPFPPLTKEQIEPILDADLIIVNFISGWDLELEAMEFLAERAGDKLYVDLHYLIMGRDKIGSRFVQLPENVERWIAAPHWLQMNEVEFAEVAGKGVSVLEFYQQRMRNDQVLVVTNGADDTQVVISEDGNAVLHAMPTYHVPDLIDTTGCGDTFGAAFGAYFMKKQNLKEAIDFANCAAAANTMLQGTNEMDKLPATMKRISELAENKQKVISERTTL